MELSLIIILICVTIVGSTRYYMKTHPMETQTQSMISFMVLTHILGYVGIFTTFGVALYG